MVLTWQGTGPVKGFILYRSEQGKESYNPITDLIPYFGRDGKERYLYRFTDNGAKPGVRYEYRLEVVGLDQEAGLMGPFSKRPIKMHVKGSVVVR
jgi:hypothetical protein